MRSDWIPLSASALVIGVMALVFGSLLNPQPSDGTAGETIRLVAQNQGQFLGMSVMFFAASVTLILGLPALLSLFTTRGRRIGLVATGVFSVGVVGIAGYAMLLVFFRALVNHTAIDAPTLDAVARDPGLRVFLYGWIGAFYVGLLLVAIALFVARRTSTWVPLVMVVYVALLPVSNHLGKVGQVVELMGLAAAFTGISIAAVNGVQERAATRQPSY